MQRPWAYPSQALLARRNSGRVVECLRANGMIVVGDHITWAVESDTIRIDLAPMPLGGLAIPAQRGGGAVR